MQESALSFPAKAWGWSLSSAAHPWTLHFLHMCTNNAIGIAVHYWDQLSKVEKFHGEAWRAWLRNNIVWMDYMFQSDARPIHRYQQVFLPLWQPYKTNDEWVDSDLVMPITWLCTKSILVVRILCCLSKEEQHIRFLAPFSSRCTVRWPFRDELTGMCVEWSVWDDDLRDVVWQLLENNRQHREVVEKYL